MNEDDGQPPLDPRRDVDVDLEPRVADLREPVAPLVDEVERELVCAGAQGRAQLDALLDLLAGLDRARDRRPDLAPDDRVAAVVEPVVRDLDLPPRSTA